MPYRLGIGASVLALTVLSGVAAQTSSSRRKVSVATVGERTITVADIEEGIHAQGHLLVERYRDPKRLQEFAQEMVRFELLAAEAERQGYGRDPVVLRTVKQHAVQQLLRSDIDAKVTAASIPAQEVERYYRDHPKEFHRAEVVRASHILLKDVGAARKLLAQVKAADTRAFREAAREHSVDTETKLRGGDLRYFDREGTPFGQMPRTNPPPHASPDPTAQPTATAKAQPLERADHGDRIDTDIATAAFSLKEVGAVVAKPVRVGDHWSLVRLTGRRPARHQSLTEADGPIRERLRRERRTRRVDRLVQSLRKRFQPVIHLERLRPVRLQP